LFHGVNLVKAFVEPLSMAGQSLRQSVRESWWDERPLGHSGGATERDGTVRTRYSVLSNEVYNLLDQSAMMIT
jgi:hypothetical protein